MDREGVNDLITDEVTKLFTIILDYVQISVPPAQYPVLRAKILRAGNDCIRNIRVGLKLELKEKGD